MIHPPYLATDGCGKRIECKTLEEAKGVVTHDLWHIYEWQGWKYVQVW